MRKTLISLLVMLFAFQVYAQTEWHLITDTDQKVAISTVDYLLAADNDSEFSVVCKDGSRIDGVTKATFELTSSVKQVSDNVELQVFPNPVVSQLNITGLNDSAQVSILSLDGKVVKSLANDNGSLSIDVSDLAPGYYLLQSENSTVKFIKK